MGNKNLDGGNPLADILYTLHLSGKHADVGCVGRNSILAYEQAEFLTI